MLEILATIALLTIMEISLSMDNAVVNAAVLKRMPLIWQKRFLTWGILVAVVGMRLIFPILIVAAATGLGFISVADTAIYQPELYTVHLLASHVQIASFGGMFLLLVFLSFILDTDKEIHWLGSIERKLSGAGRLEKLEVAIALAILITMQLALPGADQIHSLVSGIIGIVVYILIKGFSELFSSASGAIRGGIACFLYLEVLDMSFSLDGVIGAFAISKNIFVIMIGLGIGAYFVRRMTIKMVRDKMLEEYRYLEHGAQYGIFALAVIMLISTVHHVPEVVTGLIGVSFIGLSVVSSVLHRRKILRLFV